MIEALSGGSWSRWFDMRGRRGLEVLLLGAVVTILGLATMVGGGDQAQAALNAKEDCGNWTIWTTDENGTNVNGNKYDSKEDVYLNGGPRDSRQVPAGIYWYLVTDPSSRDSLYPD
ncbi:MAG: hypothetical protein ACYC66_13330, partial [Chloroflexota bacterium]